MKRKAFRCSNGNLGQRLKDMSHKVTTVALIIFAIGLSGCSSIAQGVTEALLKQDE